MDQSGAAVAAHTWPTAQTSERHTAREVIFGTRVVPGNPVNKSARKIKKNQNVFYRFSQKIEISTFWDISEENLKIS